ncbi:DNA-binding response regulator, partial [Xanthomonas perforans]
KEIPRTHYLARATVKHYVSTILATLRTRDRPRAVLKPITLRVL